MKLIHCQIAGTAAFILLVITACHSEIDATLFRNAILSGHVVYSNGRPASGVQVVAQMQNEAELKSSQMTPPVAWGSSDTITGFTKADGSYRLIVPPHLPYNILVNLAKPPAEDDRTVAWVAAAKTGVVGKANKTTPVPPLILTRGIIVTGLVSNNTSDHPMRGVYVGSYGPARPASTSMISNTMTDKAGQYRLRVMPGCNEIYIADSRYNGLSNEQAKAKGLMKTIWAATGHTTRANFQVVSND